VSRLEILEGEAWRELIAAPIAVLVLAKTTCPVCKAWLEELTAFLDADQRWQQVRFGKIFLDEGMVDGEADDDEEDDDTDTLWRSLSAELGALPESLASFERASRDWIAEVKDFPYNVIFVHGRKVKGWPGGGIDRLVTRLEGLEHQG
jgi:hypothetical protein